MVRVGLIGCGSIGADHAGWLSRRQDVEIRGFCDSDESRARGFVERFGGEYATSDPQIILRDESIEAVYVCTRNDSHARLGIAAAAAGKHIMMEKPLALTDRECDALREAVEKSAVIFMSAFKLRYEPAVEKARSHVPHPLVSIAQVTDSRWPDDFWGNDPVQGGGNVLSQGCHAADLLCYLHGSRPAGVVAYGGNMHHQGIGIVDTLTAAIRFVNGSLASLVVTDCGRTPLVSKFSVQLLDGTMTAHLSDRLKSVTLDDGKHTTVHAEPQETGLAAENADFVDAVREGRQPRATLSDGIRATQVLLAAVKSLASGREESVVE